MDSSLNFDFNDGTLYVSFIGEIDYHSAASTRDAIDEKIQELRPQNLVIDLANVPFMDFSGLGLIMGRYQRMQELTSIHIPAEVEEIADDAFFECNNICEITVDSENKNYYSEGNCLIHEQKRSAVFSFTNESQVQTVNVLVLKGKDAVVPEGVGDPTT